MSIEYIHTYLVLPNKHSQENSLLSGTSVDLNGPMFPLLNEIYSRSESECNIDITFTPTNGKQQNECRDLVLGYCRNATLATGETLARRLGQFTDFRSGIGLLFLIVGHEGQERKLVLSRFPTDRAIYVDEDPKRFQVEYLERVFLRNKNSYKAVLYRDRSLQAGFWNGKATDKQLNSRISEVSNYWIVDFLASQIAVTPKAGTLRLGDAMQKAAKTGDLHVKQEITAAATLAGSLDGELVSINEFALRFALSEQTTSAICSHLKSDQLADERFEFDAAEFNRVNPYRSVEISNGGILTAQSADFSKVFEAIPLDDSGTKVRFTTEGSIVNERLKSRP